MNDIFLVDTHCWLWWLMAPEKLNQQCLSLLIDQKTRPYFSAVNAWEISIKCSLGKLKLPKSPSILIPQIIQEDNLLFLPIHLNHTLQTTDLPLHHKDPFDRLLIAQGMVEKIPIVTADPYFKRYDIEIIQAGTE